MKFLKRLRFFSIGIILGTALSLILFGPEKFSCAGYLPEGRVLAELQTKKFTNDSLIQQKLNTMGWGGDIFKDSILPLSSIDFNKSNAQLKPCPKYWVLFPKDSSLYAITVFKCDSTAYIKNIETLN